MSEPRAPYGLPAAPGPRNLTAELAAWLRRLGFTVLEQGSPVPTALQATWRALDGQLYQVSYACEASAGIFQLLAYSGQGARPTDYTPLVFKAEINRFREARFLLLSNLFYKAARQAALDAGTLQPA